MKSTEKMAVLPKLTIQRRSFFSTGCSLLKYRKPICLKQLFFTMPNDKYIAVRDSQKDDGTFWTYYFDPEKEEEE